MSSNLRVNNILPSVGTNVAIGTAGGSITLTGTTSGTFSGNLTGNVNSTGVTTVTTLNVGTGASVSSPSSNVLTLGTNSAERLRIDSSGNIGIGTDNPGDKLVVHQGSDDDIIVRVNGADSSTEFAGMGVGSGYASFVAGGSGVTNTDMALMTTIGGTETERLRITSSGNIGIGLTNPTVFGTAYRTVQLNPASGSGDGSAIRFMYDGGTANTNDLVIYTNSSQSYIRANGARNIDVMRNGSTVATFNANGIALPSGLGIDFSATANSSGTMTSELLDDYEEGSFTPRWGDGSSAYSSPAPTYDTQRGDYTKVGNVVYYDIHLITTAWNGAGGTLWAHGLPFASRSSGYQQGGGGIFCIQGVDGANAISNLTTQVATNTSRIELYYQTASTGNNYNGFGTGDVNEAGTVSIRISGFYFTNS